MISQLGRYEIIDELGQGAMGIVYKAVDPLIDRILAIKTISLSLAKDEKDDYEQRFYQEAKAAGRLNHPNIVTVYDVGKSGEVAYIAMEFLQGRELRDLLDEGQRLPVAQVIDYAMQVAQGLAYAHEHGIVHRDVKPANIMVVRDGLVKITDFGIARMASSTVRTQVGIVLGSPKYMSPEQVLGKSIDQRSDIFSLGVMLYEMLTGQAPFAGDSINSVMYQIMNIDPPLPSSRNSDVFAKLDSIVARAMAKSLDDRYQDARALADDLRACRDESSRVAVQPPAVVPAPDVRRPDAIASKRTESDTEKTQPLANVELSENFDSSDATIRMAAMTAPEEVEDISKTLKLSLSGSDTIQQKTPAPAKPKAATSTAATSAIPGPSTQGDKSNPPHPVSTRTLSLIMAGLVVLLGIVILL
ncbi:MAG: serine/threonine-protein kinase [Gallionella sp.]|nr:serine/threonine-protein kinase [Gallionella sp.]